MPTPHPRLATFDALGYDHAGGFPPTVTADHLAAHPAALESLLRRYPAELLLIFQRPDLSPDLVQQLGEAMLHPLGQPERRRLALVALAALRDGRLLPTPAVRRQVTALMGTDETVLTEVPKELAMAALLCAEAFGWPVPAHAPQIREQWADITNAVRALLVVRPPLAPSLSYETPWEGDYVTAGAPVLPEEGELALEPLEVMMERSGLVYGRKAQDLLLLAPPNDPQFWGALPAGGKLPVRYLAAARLDATQRPPLAPVSVDVCDRITQAVAGTRRLQDAEPWLELIRAVLAEQPETTLPLYHVLLRTAARWSTATLHTETLVRCPLTPATHQLWWTIAERLLLGVNPDFAVGVTHRCLLGHRLAFPEMDELRRPPAPILGRLWPGAPANLRLLLAEYGSRDPAHAPDAPTVSAASPKMSSPTR